MMLDHLGEFTAGAAVMQSIEEVLGAGAVVTRDLGGQASTLEMADALAAAVRDRLAPTGRSMTEQHGSIAVVLPGRPIRDEI